jgi:hypothetical protein
MTPFFANNGFHPCSRIEPPDLPPSHPEMEAADKLVRCTKQINKFLRTELAWAQEDYTRHANAHRQPHPEYQIGDRVYVDARHFRLQRDSQSLASKALGL